MLIKKILLSAIIALTASCSYFRFNPEENCNNPNADCFKADTTAPHIVSTMPPANETVSTLSEITFEFSEELRDVTNIDNYIISGTGAAGLTPVSIDSLGNYTYRLNFSGLVQNGPIQFNIVLMDYNSHSLQNPTFALVGNVELEITFSEITHDYLSSSAGSNTSTDISWNHNYTIGSVGSVNHYTVRLRASSCTTGVEFASGNDLAGNTTVVTNIPVENLLPGVNSFYVCVDNQVDNKAGHSFTNLFRDDSPPASSIAPDAGAYPVPQNIEFTCEDNCDRIIYTTDGSDPSFNPDGTVAIGEVLSGTSWMTPYTADPTITNLKWTAIDRSGNREGVVHSAEYYIDSRFPLLAIQSIEYTRLSAVGSRKTTDIVWSSSDEGNYSVHLNSCSGTPIPGAVNGTGTQTAEQSILTTIPATGLSDGLNRVYFCSTRTDTAMQGYTAVNLHRDDSAPDVTVTATEANPTNEPDIYFTIVFTEPVVNFLPEALTVTNGTVAELSGSGSAYTARVAPMADGTVTLSIAAGAVEDPSGNGNIPSNTASVLYDATPPDVSLSSTVVSPTNQTEVQIEVAITESVIGFDMSSFVLTNAAPLTLTPSGSNFILTVKPSADGTVTVYLPAAKIYDAANNPNTASNTIEFIYDSTPPSVTLNPLPYINRFNVTDYNISGTCSEEGRTVSVLVDGGFVSAEAVCMSNSFTAVMNLSVIEDAPAVLITVHHTDAAGNSAPQTIVEVLKATGELSVTINSLPAINNTNQSAYTVSGNCSEEGRTVSINAGGITAEPVCSSQAYSTVLNMSTISDSAAVIITADHSDEAGNTAVQAIVEVLKATGIITVTINPPPAINNTNQSAYNVSGTCSKEGRTVSINSGGITAEPVCSSQAYSTVLNMSTISDSAAVTITADHSDAAGNSAPQAEVQVLKATGIITVTINPPSPINNTNQSAYNVSGTCSKEGRTVSINSGGITAEPVCSSQAYSTVLNMSAISDSAVTITADHTDEAGNFATQASVTVVKDTVAPSAPADLALAAEDDTGWSNTDGVTNKTSALTISGTSEPLASIKLSAAGVLLGNATANATGIWIAEISLSEGTTALVASATDTAGNTGPDSVPLNITVDTTSPTVTLTTVMFNRTNVSPIPVTITFSEAVNGLDLSDINLTGGTMILSATTPDRVWTAEITPITVLNSYETITVTLNSGAATDRAGNGNPSDSLTIFYDSKAPVFEGIDSITRSGSPVGTELTITWSAADDDHLPVDYEICQSEYLGGCDDNNWLTSYTTGSLSHVVTSADPDEIYYYQVRAVDPLGNYTQSTEMPSAYTLTVNASSDSLENGELYLSLNGGPAETLTAVNGSGYHVFYKPLGVDEDYSVAITGYTEGVVFAFTGNQYGTMPAIDLSLNVKYLRGYMTSGRYQLLKPAAMNYHLYQGRTNIVIDGPVYNLVKPNSLVFLNDNLYSGVYTVNGVGGDANGVCENNCRIMKVSTLNIGNPSYIIETLPGVVRSIATDGTNLFYTMYGNNGVWRTNPDGITPVKIATLEEPGSLAIIVGSIYVLDYAVGKVVKINLADGTGVLQVLATINDLHSLAVAGTDLYVTAGHAIYRVPLTGTPAPLFGSHDTPGFVDGTGTAPRFNQPRDIVFDGHNSLFVADNGGNRIRLVNLNTGVVSTIAGNGSVDQFVTNVVGIQAQIPGPVGITTDGKNLYVSYHEVGSGIVKISDNGLVGYWPLNGTMLDYSGVVNFSNATNNNTNSDLGRYNNSAGSAYFNGSSSYLSASSGAEWPVSNSARTLSAWIKPTALPGGNDFMCLFQYGTGLQKAGIYIHNHITQKSQIVLIGGNSTLYASYNLPINKWSHICAVYDADTSSAKIYLNGKNIGQLPTFSFNTFASDLYIGKDNFMGYYYNGQMADVRIYNRPLGESEVNFLAQDADFGLVGDSYNTGPLGLLSHYHFTQDFSSIPSLSDSGPLGIDLENFSNTDAATGKDGDIRGSYKYVSLSNYYLNSITDTTGLPSGSHPRTISMWINPDKYPIDTRRFTMFHYGAIGDTNSLEITIANDSGAIKFFISAGTGASYQGQVDYKPPLNTWTHICVLYDGNMVSIYANGKYIEGDVLGLLNTEPGALYIGRNLSGTAENYFSGKIDEVRVYNNLLTSEQIRGLAVQVPDGLIAHYDFTDNSGNGGAVIDEQLKDASGFGNHSDIKFSGIGEIAQTADRFGHEKSAYNFSGDSGNYIQADDANLPLGRSARTISLWYKKAVNNGLNCSAIYGNDDSGQTNGVCHTDESFVWYYAGPMNYLQVPLSLGNNTWHHISLTYDGANAAIYVNGEPVVGPTPESWSTISNSLMIGSTVGDSGYFTGAVDDVRIYNRVLSPEQIRALAAQPNKIIFVTAAPYSSDLGGISGADAKCMADTNHPGGGRLFKAMLVADTVDPATSRIACTIGNCIVAGGISGITENIDWVLRPHITYIKRDFLTPIFTADSNSVWNFSSPLNNNFYNPIFEIQCTVLTGLSQDWEIVTNNTASNWTSSSGTKMVGNSNSIDMDAISYNVQGNDHFIYCVEQ